MMDIIKEAVKNYKIKDSDLYNNNILKYINKYDTILGHSGLYAIARGYNESVRDDIFMLMIINMISDSKEFDITFDFDFFEYKLFGKNTIKVVFEVKDQIGNRISFYHNYIIGNVHTYLSFDKVLDAYTVINIYITKYWYNGENQYKMKKRISEIVDKYKYAEIYQDNKNNKDELFSNMKECYREIQF